MDVRAALAARARGSIDSDPFCRALVEHSGWHLPLRGGSVTVLTLDGGVEAVFIFTDAEAVAAAAEKMPFLREALTHCERDVEGERIFAYAARNPRLGIWVNPGSQPAFKFEGSDLEPFFAWASTVEVDRALAKPPEGSIFCRVLKAYAGYRVLSLIGEGPAGLEKRVLRLPFGPQDQERYVPVFTADDHRHVWMTSGAQVESLVGVDVLAGTKLFTMLRDSGMDGIVFNPNLPSPPAFRIDVCQYILDGG